MRRILNLRYLEISPPIALAPMAGITNTPFRTVCRLGGAGLVFSEMISARAMRFRNRQTQDMGTFSAEEHPVAAQIFGREPGEMAEAAVLLAGSGADIIDINMGCPVKKVLKSGSGIQLMREPEKASAIVRAVRESVRVPVTVKIRLGWSDSESNYISFGKLLADNGADAIILHPRTRVQGFSGKAQWEAIASLVKELDIPVLGSGDVRTSDDVRRIFDITNCAGLLIGRGSLGRPWVFTSILKEIAGEPVPGDDQLRPYFTALHIRLILESMPDRRAVGHLRKHLAWYSKGLPDGSGFRALINRSDSPGEIVERAVDFFGLGDEDMTKGNLI